MGIMIAFWVVTVFLFFLACLLKSETYYGGGLFVGIFAIIATLFVGGTYCLQGPLIRNREQEYKELNQKIAFFEETVLSDEIKNIVVDYATLDEEIKDWNEYVKRVKDTASSLWTSGLGATPKMADSMHYINFDVIQFLTDVMNGEAYEPYDVLKSEKPSVASSQDEK